jgi:hypothetical protein
MERKRDPVFGWSSTTVLKLYSGLIINATNMRFHKNKILVAVFVMLQSLIAFAQQVLHEKLPLENVMLTTDRTTYFSGEQIWLRADCWLTVKNDSLSKVMYVELLDRKSKPVVQKKLQILNGMSSGLIEIPSDILTGNYYIRAYTQYLRNFGRELFYTTELTIINPELPPKEMIQTIVTDTTRIVRDSTQFVEINASDSPVAHSLVSFDLTGQKNMHLCVSVVKKGSYEPQSVGIQTNFKRTAMSDSLAELKWYPEIRSVSISGKVVSKETNLPLKNTLVFASIVDSTKQFHVARTNAEGNFVFSLPHLHDNHQVYICTQKEGTLLVNPDFAAGLPAANYSTMKMDSAKRDLFNSMYINDQVTTVYNTVISTTKTFLDTLPDAFQTSSEIIFFKDYVSLPTMTDMFTEIIPYTKVKSKKNESTIILVNRKTKEAFDQPLVLLDHIPFHDHSALLNIPPSKINSIGIIATNYVFGGEVINGVINIKSKDDNLAGLPLPGDVVVVDYITYNPSITPQFDKTVIFSPEKPGLRNTLYWNPDVVLNEGKQTIQFYSDGLQYDIVVRGVDENGKAFTKIKTVKIGSKVN